MWQGIAEVLTYAVAVALSVSSIMAVILVLFSARAKVNGSAFLVGWMLALAVLMAAGNPKNLMLTLAAAVGLAQLGLPTSQAIITLIVFVAVGSITIAGPVAYSFFGGARARAQLTSLKDWLGFHNAAVMTVLFLIFGIDLVAQGLPPLTG